MPRRSSANGLHHRSLGGKRGPGDSPLSRPQPPEAVAEGQSLQGTVTWPRSVTEGDEGVCLWRQVWWDRNEPHPAVSSREVNALREMGKFKPLTFGEIHAAGDTIPIVGSTADPVSYGIVTSLARPGGNVTGISSEAGAEIDGKRLDLFKKIMPTASRLAVLTPVAVWESPYGAVIRMLAGKLGFIIVGRPLADPVDEAEFRSVFAELQQDRADVIFVVDAPEIDSNLQLVVELAESAHLPAITSGPHFVKAGSLMSYGPDPGDLVRRAAGYVDKVLRGAKPADLPVQQPTKFELIINLKTAKALGLTIPETLLATADKLIE
jgi:putative tryptophan/tyrosine transport system substrate-binding protein